MMTPDQLVLELKRYGYEVTCRRLRDWRDKGLLPPLIRRGRGRGSGAVHFWNDAAVLNQAITVCELLARRTRCEGALLGTWFAGYPIDVERARKAWLSSISRTKAGLFRGGSSKEKREDAVGELSGRLAKKLACDVNQNWKEVERLLSEILNAYFNPFYKIDIDEMIANTARAALNLNAKSPEGLYSLNVEKLYSFLEFIRKSLSLDSMRYLISSATDNELRQAHLRWRYAIQIVKLASAKVNRIGNQSELEQPGMLLAATFGAPCIFALLYLEKAGKGPQVDYWLDRIESMVIYQALPVG